MKARRCPRRLRRPRESSARHSNHNAARRGKENVQRAALRRGADPIVILRSRSRPMTRRIPLTLACGDYEIVRAVKEETIRPDGIDLTVLTEMDSAARHWRFLRNG